jgi:hypothetical protein
VAITSWKIVYSITPIIWLLCRYAKHLVLHTSLDANAYLELFNLIVFFLKLYLIIFFAKQFIQMRVTIVKLTRILSFIIFKMQMQCRIASLAFIGYYFVGHLFTGEA